MAVQVILNTPLADALTSAIQAKLLEASFTQPDNAAELTEYIVLMLVNGRPQEEIVADCSELLNPPSGDPSAVAQFVSWMFAEAESLNAQLNAAAAEQSADAMSGMGEDGGVPSQMDTDMSASSDPSSSLNAPTGPRSMRNGQNPRGGREKRMLGHMSKAMDRTPDVLHRTRGNDRINSHARGPPTGPRGGGGMRGGRGGMNARNIQAGLNAMGGMNGGAMPGAMGGNWGMPAGQPDNMELMALMQQQSQMMAQLQQQLMDQNGGGGRGGRHGNGKSLFERTQNPHRNNNRNRHNRGENKHEGGANGDGAAGGEGGEDVDMKREAPNPEETICKFNLRCTNKECKFAHQSPAAPPGTTVDVNDVCSFGAACKNHKCVGRHPSPATKMAHQSEQDCKFFPNCQNPRCPFRHPEMPLCRNGGGCTTEGCKFTHLKTKCRFNPCKNSHCPYIHDEGQQGVFKDKVWTAEGSEHPSERKFVDENAQEEVIITEDDIEHDMAQGNGAQELIT